MSSELQEPVAEEGTAVDEGRTADMKWYAVHALSGYEEKARRFLEMRVQEAGLQELFGEVIIPTEMVASVVDGKKKETKRRSMPGYLFVQMVLNDETWHLVRDTEKITGFVGDTRRTGKDSQRPRPMRPGDIAKVQKQMEEGAQAPKPAVTFEEGMSVRIVEGPFASFTGTIDEVRADKQKLRVLVTIFGRATPVELDFMQVEKM